MGGSEEYEMMICGEKDAATKDDVEYSILSQLIERYLVDRPSCYSFDFIRDCDNNVCRVRGVKKESDSDIYPVSFDIPCVDGFLNSNDDTYGVVYYENYTHDWEKIWFKDGEVREDELLPARECFVGDCLRSVEYVRPGTMSVYPVKYFFGDEKRLVEVDWGSVDTEEFYSGKEGKVLVSLGYDDDGFIVKKRFGVMSSWGCLSGASLFFKPVSADVNAGCLERVVFSGDAFLSECKKIDYYDSGFVRSLIVTVPGLFSFSGFDFSCGDGPAVNEYDENGVLVKEEYWFDGEVYELKEWIKQGESMMNYYRRLVNKNGFGNNISL